MGAIAPQSPTAAQLTATVLVSHNSHGIHTVSLSSNVLSYTASDGWLAVQSGAQLLQRQKVNVPA